MVWVGPKYCNYKNTYFPVMFMCSWFGKLLQGHLKSGYFLVGGFNIHPSIKNTLGVFYVMGTGQTAVNKRKQEKVPVYTMGVVGGLYSSLVGEDRQ